MNTLCQKKMKERIKDTRYNLLLPYRGVSLIRNHTLPGPYSGTMPLALWWPHGGGVVSYERGAPVHSLAAVYASTITFFFFFFTLVTGSRKSLSLKLSDTRVYEPQYEPASKPLHVFCIDHQPIPVAAAKCSSIFLTLEPRVE